MPNLTAANDGLPIEGVSSAAFYAVYDGHAGARAAKHCADRLHNIIARKFPKGKPPTAAAREAPASSWQHPL